MPNNIIILVTIDKFDPNPILIYINKLKPYKFIIENKILQHVLANLSDLVIDEHVQTKELEPLPIENANSRFVEFEPVNNYLTHGYIIGIDVPIHYHNGVPIEFNYLPDCNDQNNTFSKGPINICTLEVYNPINRIYSLPHNCC